MNAFTYAKINSENQSMAAARKVMLQGEIAAYLVMAADKYVEKLLLDQAYRKEERALSYRYDI